jgi:alanyl-tRNA synthetase
MTERLYYDNPSSREFDAQVTRVEADGDRQSVWLDRTCFYPTTGGQPFDTGHLSSRAVENVAEDAAGDIVHTIAAGAPPFMAGERVHGEIDWPRRFDHMQQHTGQHVLSAAFDHLFGVRTMSFHLGAESSTIDLAREMKPQEIAAAEDESNRIVWEDRAVSIRYAGAEEAATLPLRKESIRTGTLRLIDIEAFDLSACGGTHVSRTGAIGLVAVASAERFKGGQRVEFLCGGRALKRLRQLRDTTAAAVRLLSVLPSELPAGIERLQGEAKEQKRLMTALQADLAALRADALARSAQPYRSFRLVMASMDADAPGLKAAASAIVASPGFVVVLVSNSSPALVVAAKSPDVQGLACQDLVNALTQAFGGRGGGKPELAQGGGIAAPADAVLARARDALGA